MNTHTAALNYFIIQFRFLLAVGLLFFSSAALKAEPNQPPEIDITQNNITNEALSFLYFVDRPGVLNVNELASNHIVGKLIAGRIHSGLYRATHWVSFRLRNNSDQVLTRIFSLDAPYHSNVDLYENTLNGWQKIESGVAQPVNARQIKFHLPCFSLSIPPGQTKTYFVSINSPITSWSLGFNLQDLETNQHTRQSMLIGLSIYYGAVTAIILYNLSLLLVLRDKLYAYYVAYSVALFLFTLGNTGFILYFFALSPESFHLFPGPSSGLGIAFFVLFTRELLNTAKNQPRLDNLFRIGVLVLFIVSFLTLTNLRFFDFVKILALIINPLLIYSGLYAHHKRHQYALLFLLAYTPYLVGIIWLTLENLGLISFNLWSQYGYLGGSLIELILLSLLLAYRIKFIQRENEKAQNTLLTLKNSQGEQLEQLVLERTNQLNEAVKSAQKANQAKSLFLANMSHELRTPIHGVLGMGELVLKTNLDSRQRAYIESAQRAAKNLIAIINDILDFSKIEAGELQIEYIRFRLDEILQSIFDVFDQETKNKGINLLTHIDQTVPKALIGDPNRLRQVIVNLVSNAVKFTEAGGTITISIFVGEFDEQGAQLFVTVEDTGIGIAEAQQPQLFEAFIQAENSISRKYGGTGLGLSICHRLVSLMRGEIKLESKLGIGSRFTFFIHVGIQSSSDDENANEPLSRDNPNSISHLAKLEGIKILLVEDNSLNQEIASEMLRGFGIRVIVANNGLEAIDRLNEDVFDVVLMDCHMPVMDGYLATQKIREQEKFKNLLILAMTADVMTEGKERALSAGMNGFITKPVTSDQLLQTLLHWLPDRQETNVEHQVKQNSNDNSVINVDFQSINLPGIDFVRGLGLFGGNKERYLNLLEKFANQYCNFSAQFQQLQNSDFKAATRELHSLKSASAWLGMTDLSELAKQLEGLYNQKDQCINGASNRLVTELSVELRRILDCLIKNGIWQEPL